MTGTSNRAARAAVQTRAAQLRAASRAPRIAGIAAVPAALSRAALIAALACAASTAGAQPAAESAAVRTGTARGAAAAGAAVPPIGTTAALRARGKARADEARPPDAVTTAEAAPACVGGLPAPVQVQINAGKSTLLNLPEPIARRTLGDPEIADARMVSPQVMYLVSGRIGTTNAILQGHSGRCMVLDIVVAIDTDAVQAKITELMPAEKGVKVSAAGDSLVLNGTVSDALAADRAVAIANAYVRTAYQQGIGGGTGSQQGRLGTQLAQNGAAPQLARIINLLSVGAPQQVMLEVKVAEVAKTLLDKLGASVNAARTDGSWTYQLLSNFLTGELSGMAGAVKNSVNNIVIDAEKRDGMLRILAEPNVMAISGQEGSFLAGGKILIPVAQSNVDGVLRITLEEKEFGVGLKFTPTVLADGRINLRVAPEVSELSREGVGISSTVAGGRAVFPLITTRRAATTVQLFDGQSFAIGGLIKNNVAANLKALPILGEIPILGALFRSTDFQSEKTELVFIVTPRLVKPLPPDYRLPTDRIGEPTRQGVFLGGQLDSAPPSAPAAAPQGAAPAGGMELK